MCKTQVEGNRDIMGLKFQLRNILNNQLECQIIFMKLSSYQNTEETRRQINHKVEGKRHLTGLNSKIF